jgi:serine/threonine protein kinase/Tfp pilus assembly protein PilF
MIEKNNLFEKYRLLSLLQQSPLVKVHLASAEDGGRVVLKRYHISLDTEQKQQFWLEVRQLQQLRHPALLPLLDAGIVEREDVVYLVSPYAAGGSLQQRFDDVRFQPFDQAGALEILKPIGEALNFAHQQQIVHRNLKPSKILFDDKGRTLLADLGISVLFTPLELIDLVGTLPYTAPECFGGMPANKLSNQYSLGCIAYEIVTAQKAFSSLSPTVNAYQEQHTRIKPVSPTLYQPDLPVAVEQAILKALAKERLQRHASVIAFVEQLGDSGAASVANPVSTPREVLVSKKKVEIAPVVIAIDQVRAYQQEGRLQEALALLEELIRAEPENASFLLRQSALLLQLHRPLEARAAYLSAFAIAPGLAAIDREITFLPDLPPSSNIDAVQQPFNPESQTLPVEENRIAETMDGSGQTLEDISPLVQQGMALNQARHWEEALEAFSEALRADPHAALAYFGRGIALGELGKVQEALAAYERFLRLRYPDAHLRASAHYGRGDLLSQLERYEEAVAAFEQAAQANPQLSDAYLGKGNVLERLQLFEEALQAYDQAIQAEPDYSVVYRNKGVLLNKLGYHAEALTAFEASLRIEPYNVKAQMHRALQLYALGRDREAVESFSEALQLGLADIILGIDEMEPLAALEHLSQLF